MNKTQLEHILISASKIGDDNEIIVIGSQSVLGQFPEAGDNSVLSYSMEADIYLKNRLENTILVEGAIGEGSMFHQTFGYYAQEVGPNTAILSRAGRKGFAPFKLKAAIIRSLGTVWKYMIWRLLNMRPAVKKITYSWR